MWRRFDAPDWEGTGLRRALEAEIAERCEVSIEAVHLELESVLSGRDVAVDSTGLDTEGGPDTAPAAKARDSDPSIPDGVPATAVDPPSSAEVPPGLEPACAGPATSSEAADEGNVGESDFEETAAPRAATSTTESAAPAATGMKSLRGRMWTLALRLANRNGLGELVVPLPSKGLGFLLTDVPEPALCEQLDEDTLAKISMLWWFLAACAEVTVAPIAVLADVLPDDSVLKKALVEQDAGLLFASVWTLDPGHTGYRLWRGLSEKDWRDTTALMETYRALHHLADERGCDLWGVR